MINSNLIQFLKVYFVSKQCIPDQTPRFDLFFHCLPMSDKKDARLKWVNIYKCICYSMGSDIFAYIS